MENQLGSARLPIFKKYVLKRQSRKPSKNELNAEQIKCKGLGRNFDHAPRAGRELTAGGSRTQTSIADATGKCELCNIQSGIKSRSTIL